MKFDGDVRLGIKKLHSSTIHHPINSFNRRFYRNTLYPLKDFNRNRSFNSLPSHPFWIIMLQIYSLHGSELNTYYKAENQLINKCTV